MPCIMCCFTSLRDCRQAAEGGLKCAHPSRVSPQQGFTQKSCVSTARWYDNSWGQAQNGVEMNRAWVTHHHCPLALKQSVMGGPGINVNRKHKKTHISSAFLCKVCEIPSHAGYRLPNAAWFSVQKQNSNTFQPRLQCSYKGIHIQGFAELQSGSAPEFL